MTENGRRGPLGPVLSRRGTVPVTCRAFSLIEIIIAVALMTVMMLGLLMMFNQTQRAFQGSITQTDVLESGRAAVALLSREMEQITPVYGVNTNFVSYILAAGRPLPMPLPGVNGLQRTNVMEDLFFISRENQLWTGIGYFVRVEDAAGRLGYPVETANGNQQLMGGRLYRFEDQRSVLDAQSPWNLYTNFLARTEPGAYGTNSDYVTKLIDGVVHFKVRAYDPDGRWITNNTQWIVATNYDKSFSPPEIRYYEFQSNAVPASLEFELGLVEDRAWERYKSLPEGNARYNYLTNQAGRTHIFRQRVAVRNVDPAAYQ